MLTQKMRQPVKHKQRANNSHSTNTLYHCCALRKTKSLPPGRKSTARTEKQNKKDLLKHLICTSCYSSQLVYHLMLERCQDSWNDLRIWGFTTLEVNDFNFKVEANSSKIYQMSKSSSAFVFLCVWEGGKFPAEALLFLTHFSHSAVLSCVYLEASGCACSQSLQRLYSCWRLMACYRAMILKRLAQIAHAAWSQIKHLSKYCKTIQSAAIRSHAGK